MPTKRKNFSEVFKNSDNNQPKKESPTIENSGNDGRAKPVKISSRAGKKALATYIDKEAFKQVKILSAQLEVTQEALVIEALNDFFQKHKLPRLA